MRTHWRGRVRLVAVALSVTAFGLSGSPASAQAPTQESAAQAAPTVRINEVESNGGSPGDWVEVVNTGTTAVDLSGWVVKDNDNSHSYTVAAGTSLAAGGHLALDVDSSFGLGSSDSARLFRAGGSTLVDSYSWTAHASTTYGRCADGTGAFTTTTAPTKGAANACGQSSGSTWPGGSGVTVADASNVFGENLSGLSFQSPGVLWAVRNGPSRLYRLVPNGATWRPDPSGGWASGKALNYANGSGDPDAEGVSFSPDGLYVATERDNDNDGVSLPKILRYDAAGTAGSLNATAEWNLTADLPAVAANSGLEGISWIPDTFLTAHGFRDEHTGAAYDPAAYPGHGSGLVFAGLEANGTVYAYALNQSGGGYTRVATFTSGFPAVMDLEFEPATGHLWASCDDTCQGRSAVLDIDAQGRFTVTARYDRPTGMPDYNNEGFAIAPQAACVAGVKPVVWADDGNDGGHALRAGTLACTP
ncbi:lamin tail domain-containing protein [Embleya sp. NPDC059213]|uniref:lamin tail domain-containing protein n=1 Tax=Embleya sp. NPDC059213 TaxID=3346771 RepID=UPI00367EBEBC